MTIDPRRTLSLFGEEVVASRHALTQVLRAPDLRRIQMALVGYSLAEWASFIAISVYAFQVGGSAAVGVVAVVQLVPSALVAPFAAVFGDRFRREKVLQIAYAIEVVAVGGLAVALLAGAEVRVVFAMAALTAVSFTLVRPIHASLIPLLARTPAETTAGYVVVSMIEYSSAVVGPLLAAAVLAVAGPGAVYAVLVVVLALATVLVSRVTTRTRHPEVFGSGTRVLSEAVRGFELVIKDARQRVLVGMLGGANVVLGLLDVLLVVLAFDVFGTGESGTGVLNAALGVGGVLGAIGTVSLIGRNRLAPAARNGMLLYGIPIALSVFAAYQWMALAALVVAGVGSAMVAVSGRTMLQRVAPNDTLSRIFGVVEGSYMAGEAVGAVTGAILVATVGIDAALVAAGLFLPLLWLVRRGALKRADVGIRCDAEVLSLLHALPLFEALGPAEIERVAGVTEQIRVPARTRVVTQGDVADRFYVIKQGTVRVARGDTTLATFDRGDYFGEIALLRDVPRTATVTAVTDLDLLAIDRGHFVEAVVPFTASARSTDELIDQRLAVHHT
jgi:MFS family permease